MRKIKSITVVTEDLEELVFEGEGKVLVTETYVPGAKAKDNRPVKYVTATLNLPVES